jgi:uncharacterized membrane protein
MNEPGLILLIAGSLFITAAFIWMRFPPVNINSLYGYRTGTSMRNDMTWKEANTYASRLLLKIASITIFLGIILFLIPVERTAGAFASLGIVICDMIFLIWKTEKHLSKIFDKTGARRQTENR